MPLEHFSSDGVDIAFLDSGEGEPILLIHGFASNHVVNWGATGWIDTLKRRRPARDRHGRARPRQERQALRPRRLSAGADGRRRGATSSTISASRAPTSWAIRWARGSRVSLALAHPETVRSMILGGMGSRWSRACGGEDEIVAALEAPSLDDVTGEPGRAYRKFAEQTGSDLRALAACMRGQRADCSRRSSSRRIRMPVLVAVGDEDKVAGSAEGARPAHPRGRGVHHPQPRPHARHRRQAASRRRCSTSSTGGREREFAESVEILGAGTC